MTTYLDVDVFGDSIEDLNIWDDDEIDALKDFEGADDTTVRTESTDGLSGTDNVSQDNLEKGSRRGTIQPSRSSSFRQRRGKVSRSSSSSKSRDSKTSQPDSTSKSPSESRRRPLRREGSRRSGLSRRSEDTTEEASQTESTTDTTTESQTTRKAGVSRGLRRASSNRRMNRSRQGVDNETNEEKDPSISPPQRKLSRGLSSSKRALAHPDLPIPQDRSPSKSSSGRHVRRVVSLGSKKNMGLAHGDEESTSSRRALDPRTKDDSERSSRRRPQRTSSLKNSTRESSDSHAARRPQRTSSMKVSKKEDGDSSSSRRGGLQRALSMKIVTKDEDAESVSSRRPQRTTSMKVSTKENGESRRGGLHRSTSMRISKPPPSGLEPMDDANKRSRPGMKAMTRGASFRRISGVEGL